MFLAFLGSPLAKYVGLFIGISLALGGLYMAVDHRGYSRCEGDVQLANLHAQEEAHQTYLAAVEKGEELAAELAVTQRKLDNVKREYLAYANGISGNCPADLGVLINSAASNTEVPKPTSKPADPSATIGASLVAANIAENYSRANSCIAQLNALIDCHTSQKDLEQKK
jgi:hypothetical protein